MSATTIAPRVHGPGRAGTASRGAVREGRPVPAAGQLRLTARGRAVVWLLGLLLAGGVGGAAASAYADGPEAATEVRRVVVAPGDTLWAIAAEVAGPDEDVRDVVLELMALNELPSGGLQAGATIVVPVA